MTWWETVGVAFAIFIGLVILVAVITVAYNNWDYIMFNIQKSKTKRKKIEDYSEIIMVSAMTTFVAGIALGYFIGRV